jgi:hypothetical protein
VISVWRLQNKDIPMCVCDVTPQALEELHRGD